MKAYKTTYRLATIPMYAKREADYQGYRYTAYDVKDLVGKHKQQDHVELRDNIICASNKAFYTRIKLIMRVLGCDVYPNDFSTEIYPRTK